MRNSKLASGQLSRCVGRGKGRDTLPKVWGLKGFEDLRPSIYTPSGHEASADNYVYIHIYTYRHNMIPYDMIYKYIYIYE